MDTSPSPQTKKTPQAPTSFRGFLLSKNTPTTPGRKNPPSANKLPEFYFIQKYSHHARDRRTPVRHPPRAPARPPLSSNQHFSIPNPQPSASLNPNHTFFSPPHQNSAYQRQLITQPTGFARHNCQARAWRSQKNQQHRAFSRGCTRLQLPPQTNKTPQAPTSFRGFLLSKNTPTTPGTAAPQCGIPPSDSSATLSSNQHFSIPNLQPH